MCLLLILKNFQNQWQTTDLQASANWFNQQPQQHESYSYNQTPQQGTQPFWQQNYNPQMQNQTSNQYNQQPGFYNMSYQQNSYGNVQFDPSSEQQSLNNSFDQVQSEADTWNWGWGDEDNSNMQAPSTNSNATTASNTLDSFTNDKTWEWSVSDNNSVGGDNKSEEENKQLFSKVSENYVQNIKSEIQPEAAQPVERSSKQHLKMTHLNAIKNENLTPQWSVESQMSQDSSDDIIHTSESDKSHKLSRSSTISQSPLSAHDTNFESSSRQEQLPFDSNLELSVKHPSPSYNDNQKFTETSGNREILGNKEFPASQMRTTKTERVTSTPPKSQTPILPPPVQNPYKQNLGYSHRSANKFLNIQQDNGLQGSSNIQGVNLETLPDNSEQPDLPQKKPSMRRISPSKNVQLWQENIEVAPINDRNQYLETGQLSDIDLNQSDSSSNNLQQDASDTLPPPGLRRMVLGQMEQNEHTGSSINEEPPPGLSRMVLGQTENSSTLSGTNDPPFGVRLIPGESSSPETTSRQQQYQSNSYASEVELSELTAHASPQPRSATIGADTPPNVNRSETIIGSDTPISNDLNQRSDSRFGADGLDNQTGSGESNRRQSIEGQPEDSGVTALTNIVRDLTVGENTTDGAISGAGDAKRKTSRQESSDSDRDRRDPSPRSHRERKHDDRNKGRSRERYSPDSFRDKKYDRSRYRDRRYEEDTDYYSEKERERRNREEYERKYSSLRREKEKERKRRERHDYGRDDRRDYYYGRYDDDYENDTRYV